MENETKKRPSAWMAVIIAVVAICLTICGVMAIIGILIDNRQDDPEAFDACMDEMFKELVVQNTINLHYTLAYPENYGITDYPVTLGDVSVENLQRSADELKEIVTDDAGLFSRIEEFLRLHQPEDVKKLRFYQDELLPLNKLYSVERFWKNVFPRGSG